MILAHWLKSVVRRNHSAQVAARGPAPTLRRRRRLRSLAVAAETLEGRVMLAGAGPQLIAVTPNSGGLLNLTDNNANERSEAFREVTLTFSEGQAIDAGTLGGIVIRRANHDGAVAPADPVVTPGYIGIGGRPNEVVIRFAENLSDDVYQIQIKGTGPTALKNTLGNAFNNGADKIVQFRLDLGTQVEAVVPQPVLRDVVVEIAAVANLRDGDKITVAQGDGVKIFEFDNNNASAAGNIRVAIVAGNATATATNLRNAINAATGGLFDVTATSAAGKVTLVGGSFTPTVAFTTTLTGANNPFKLSDGALKQKTDRAVVHFTTFEKLDPALANQPGYYRLVDAATGQVRLPQQVIFHPNTEKAVLVFATPLPTGTWNLQIGANLDSGDILDTKPAVAGLEAEGVRKLGTIFSAAPYTATEYVGDKNGAKDVDLYQFDLSAGGTVTIIAAPQSGLAIGVRVFDANGVENVTGNVTTAPDGTVTRTVTLAAGRYYVGISATGNLVYDAVTGTNAANGSGTGSYKLTVASNVTIPGAEGGGADANSSFETASNLNTLGAAAQTISAAITPRTLVALPLEPGGNDEPGHKSIPVAGENHINGNLSGVGPVTPQAVQTKFYNFASFYGFDPQGNQLFSVITENQKQRAREIFSIISSLTGLRFVETAAQGIQVVTGDLRALDPTIPTGPGGVAGLATLGSPGSTGGLAIMDAAENWGQSEYGGGWFSVAFHEIMHALGLQHAYDIDAIMGGGLAGEPVFPSDYDVTHLRRLYPRQSTDIDLYKFTVEQAGRFRAETIAQRATAGDTGLDTVLTLYREVNGVRTLVSRNDNYYGADSFLDLDLEAGTYYIGVSSVGNDAYDPAAAQTGANGRRTGTYELKLNLEVPPADMLADTAGGTPQDKSVQLDGDNDGKAGGIHNFYFKTGTTLFVDAAGRTVTNGQVNDTGDGSIANPFKTISAAIAVAAPDTIIRIVGNGGTDGNAATLANNTPYLIGVDDNLNPLADGDTFRVPKDVTVMIDAGAVLKFRRAIIDVGTFTQGVDQSGGALQVLGTPGNDVQFTSYRDDSIGGNSDGVSPGASRGDWGGIVFRRDSDVDNSDANGDDSPGDLPAVNAFLNTVNHATIRFGGGPVFVDSQQFEFAPIYLATSRPTVTFNTILNSAGPAISANPDSFSDALDRIGPKVYGNKLAGNSLNGLFIRSAVAPGAPLERLTVSARFASTDIVYVIAQNLQIAGDAGGAVLSPELQNLTVTATGGTFRLTLGGQTTGPIAFNASAAAIQQALEGLALLEPGDVLVTSVGNGRFAIRLLDPVAATQAMSVNTSQLTGGGASVALAQVPRANGRLKIDPGVVVKLSGARIESELGGSNFIAEGTDADKIVFTSLADDRYGAGGTFDTSNDVSTSSPQKGDWGGIVFDALSTGSLDRVLVTHAGGVTPIDGGFAEYNAVEIIQANVRIARSTFTNNANGVTNPADGSDANANNPDRNGHGWNAAATVFVRGAQPVIVGNIFTNNDGAVVSADVNSLSEVTRPDMGRSTGLADVFTQYAGNYGPLVRDNRLNGNEINGMEVRGGLMTAAGVWDDTDIVHVLRSEVIVPNFHTFGGLRLQSDAEQSLVVKLAGPTAGFTASGKESNIDDRIGGTVQVIGAPGHPVVLTSLFDGTIGAGLKPDGSPLLATVSSSQAPAAGDWNGIKFDQFSNDTNVATIVESEKAVGTADINRTPADTQVQKLGRLAPNEKSGDENRRLGFDVRGTINYDTPGDMDVYSFTAEPGTEVWLDLDATDGGLASIVELVNGVGQVLAMAYVDPATGQMRLLGSTTYNGIVYPALALTKDPQQGGDYFTVNPLDAGMRVILPGSPLAPGGEPSTYFVRVRSMPAAGALPTIAAPRTGEGATSGRYQLKIRLSQRDKAAGSTVRFADIRYATNGIQAIGLPRNSPLTGDAGENEQNAAGQNDTLGTAQNVGNMMTSNRAAISISGKIATPADVDFFQFSVNYDDIQQIAGVSSPAFVPVVFDLDYADQLARANTRLALFDSTGRLVLAGRDANIADDQPGPGTGANLDDLTRGSAGRLDPFMGTVMLPVGTYYLAVYNERVIPQVLDQTLNAASANPLVRVEPLDSVRRIAEDHIGSTLYTTGKPPQIAQLFSHATGDTNPSAIPFHLGDVNLFVSQVGQPNGGQGAGVRMIDPFTGAVVTVLGGFGRNIGDIAMRADGELFTFTTGTPNVGPDDGNTGNYLRIDTGTAGATQLGDDTITTFGLDGSGNLGSSQPGGNSGLNYQALTFIGTGDQDGFAVANRYVGDGDNTSTDERNILYQFNSRTGAAITQVNPLRAGGNPDTRQIGAGTDVWEVGIIDTSAGAGLGGIVTGITSWNGTLYAVDNLGGLYRVSFGGGVNTTFIGRVPGANERQRIRVAGTPGAGTTFKLSFNGQQTADIPFNATPAQIQAALRALPGVGTNEVQRLAFNPNINGGKFTLTFNGQTTAPIDFNASPAQIQAALDALNAFAPGDVTVSGSFTAVNEVQTITIAAGSTGTFTLSFNGQTTANIDPATATAASLQTALEGLSTVGAGNVAVALTAPGQFRVTFQGALRFQDVPQITSDNTGLTTGSVATATQTEGVSPSANEVQQLDITATGGTFTLTFNGQTTAPIAFNASAAQIQQALRNLANIGPFDVVVTQPTAGVQSFLITFQGTLANTNVSQLFVNTSSLSGGGATVATNTQGRSPVVTLTFGGQYAGLNVSQITADSSGLTGGMITATTQTQGSGDITVTGSALPGGAVIIEFGGQFAGQNVAQIQVVSGTDPSANVVVDTINDGFTAGDLQGLSLGPDQVEGGKYANTFFTITGSGRIIAFKTDGVSTVTPDNVLLDGQSFVDTGLSGVHGLAFGTLDRNLWHVSTNRDTDAGHGITVPVTNSREAAEGGASLYFGNNVRGRSAGNKNDMQDTEVHNYNFPGGAYGSIVSNAFDLSGYSAGDRPALYFNYFLDTENQTYNPDTDPLNPMRDSLRVYIADDSGNWHLLATNNSYQDDERQDEFDYNGLTDGFNTDFPNQRAEPYVQELLDNTGAWRQARIDLSAYAGLKNLRLRFDFATAGSMDVGNIMTQGEHLRTVRGDQLRDGQTVTITDKGASGPTTTFEFDFGTTIVATGGSKIDDGQTFTLAVSGGGTVTFEFDKDGTVGAGNRAVTITNSSTADQVAAAIQAAINASGLAVATFRNGPDGGVWNRVNVQAISLAATITATASAGLPAGFLEGTDGVGAGNVRLRVNQNMTRDQIATVLKQALADQYSAGDITNIKGYQDLIYLIGHSLTNQFVPTGATALGIDKGLPGDTFGGARSGATTYPGSLRGMDNAHEGVYIDDLIIGFAERGELVTGAPVNSTFVPNSETLNPNVPAPNRANYNPITVGEYQLEIRRGLDYGHAVDSPLSTQTLILDDAFDVNDRMSGQTQLTLSAGRDIEDGAVFTITDGIRTVEFEFVDSTVRNTAGPANTGVAARVAILYTPSFTAPEVALAVIAAINSAAVRNALRGVSAQLSSGSTDFTNTGAATSFKVDLFGMALARTTIPGEVSAASAVSWVRNNRGQYTLPNYGDPTVYGDQNRERPQGQLILENNQIRNSSEWGIVIDAGPRDANGNSSLGTPINFSSLNNARLAPGVVVMNNIVAFGGQGGITIKGDDNANGAALATVPFARLVNNTIFGDLTPTGVGVGIATNAAATLLNNIVSGTATGISVDGSSAANTVVGTTVFKDNTANGTTGSNAILLASYDPLFVNPSTGNFYLAGNRETDSLAFNVTAAAIQSALEAIVGAGNVTVTGTVAAGFTINFVGALANRDVSPLKVTSAAGSLTGATVSMTTVREGGGGQNEQQRLTFSGTPTAGFFRIGFQPRAVDSSLTSLGDRTAFAAFKNPLGIPPSNIISPLLDRYSQTRVDDPRVDPPPGLGTNVFQDRGAIERADFVGPTLSIDSLADLVGTPIPGTDTDQDGRATFLTFNGGRPATITFRLTDPGIGVDDSTVTAAAFRVTRLLAGQTTPTLLVAGVDYIFSYDTNTKQVFFTSTTGQFDYGAYVFVANNSSANGITDAAGNTLLPNRNGGITAFRVDFIPPPQFVVGDAQVIEGDAGTKTLRFTVTLSSSTGQPVSVHYSTSDGTAKAGVDYAAASGTLNFGAAETQKFIDVTIIGDTLPEGDENFFVNLDTPSAGVDIGDPIGIGTIRDDDVPTVSIGDAVVTEGDNATGPLATFTLTLSKPVAAQVEVDVATADFTATAGSDYTPVTQTVTFAPNQTTATVSVRIIGDLLPESFEQFFVNVTGARVTLAGGGTPTPISVARSRGVGGILDDDAPTISVSDAGAVEGDGFATFTITLSKQVAFPVTVTYATRNGTAAAGQDFTTRTGTLNFDVDPSTGRTPKSLTVTVPILTDGIVEPVETFYLDLTAITSNNASFTKKTGVGRIIDQLSGSVGFAVGSGPGADPRVRVYDAHGNARANPEFFAYSTAFNRGVRVAVGDVTGDGVAEIIVAPMSGIAPIRVFGATALGYTVLASFFPFSPAYDGGVSIAVGDIDPQNANGLEIFAATSSGDSAVRVFRVSTAAATGTLLTGFNAFTPGLPIGYLSGINIAVADVGGQDGIAEVIVGTNSGTIGPVARVLTWTGAMVSSFYAFSPVYAGGINVAAGDVNGDAMAEVIASLRPGDVPAVRVFNGLTGGYLNGFVAYAPSFTGGVNVGIGDVNLDGKADILTAPASRSLSGDNGIKAFDALTATKLLGSPSVVPPWSALVSGASVAGRTFAAPLGQGLRLDGAPVNNPAAATVSQAQAQTLAKAAVERLAAAGASAADLAKLATVQIVVADLPSDYLGEALAGSVVIDVNAGGYGWFIDPTPGLDEEFARDKNGVYRAIAPQAQGKVDLLTVLTHELAHQLGFEDIDPASRPNSLMTATLPPSVRRASKEQVDDLFADHSLFGELLTV